MNVHDFLVESVGGVWHGVSFFETIPECPSPAYPGHGIRFCEAFVVARVHSVLLDPRGFTCAGAKVAFGCGDHSGEEMTRRLQEKGYPPEYLETAILQTPRLEKAPAAVGINLRNPPDVFVAALQPEEVMRLLRIYEKHQRKVLSVPLSTLMSLCANIAVRSFLTGDASLSFGCPDARTFGAISRDRLLAGIPVQMARSWAGA